LLESHPTLPAVRGIFGPLTEPEFIAVARKAQGFTDAETAKAPSFCTRNRHRIPKPAS